MKEGRKEREGRKVKEEQTWDVSKFVLGRTSPPHKITWRGRKKGREGGRKEGG